MTWPSLITRPLSPISDVSPHCTAPGCCRTDTATVDGVNGRRCDTHPPVFLPAYAVHLAVTGWPHTATAYCRSDLP